MVPLEENRTGFIYFVVQLATSSFRALDVVVNFDAVEGYRDFVANDRGLAGLPLIARFGDELVGRFEVVNGAIAAFGGCATWVIAKYLNLMSPAQVEAAIGVVRHHKFVTDGKV